MKRYMWLSLIIVVISAIAFCCIYIYRNIGIIEYNNIVSQIPLIKDEVERKQVKEIFMGEGLDDALYTGVVSYVSTYGEGGVLVYRKSGFRYFSGYKDTVFMYQSICAGDPVQTIKNGKTPQVEKIVTNNVNKWAKYVKVGDFVQIVEIEEDGKDVKGNLKEARATDFVPFLVENFNDICGNY